MSNIEEALNQLKTIPGLQWDSRAIEDYLESDAESQKRQAQELMLASGPAGPEIVKTMVDILSPIVAVFGGVGTVASGVEALKELIK